MLYKLHFQTGSILALSLLILALQLTLADFPYNTCLTLLAAEVTVTLSLESLIRLTHGSSFRNSLGVWDVRAGHYRLRAFFLKWQRTYRETPSALFQSQR